MHIGCELFTKQAGHNGFQFLLTATCIDCDRVPEMNDTSIVKLVSDRTLPQHIHRAVIMSDHIVASG